MPRSSHLRSKALLLVLVFQFFIVTSVMSQQTRAREYAPTSSVRRQPVLGASTALKPLVDPPLAAGTYSVGSTGDFATLELAFNRLSGGGILGPVTLLLIDSVCHAWATSTGSYNLLGPIAGAGPSSRITIRPADNVSARIEGSGSATLIFQNVSYLTLDGIGLEGNTRLFIHTTYNLPGTSWNDGIDFIGDCDFDTIRNLTVRTDDITRTGTAAIALWADSQGAPDSCLISGVSVTSGGMGVFVGGLSPGFAIKPRGNVVRDNHIGSPVDSLVSRGVQLEATDGTVVEGNRVENLRLVQQDLGHIPRVMGIDAYFCMNTSIRNNVVHGLRGSDGALLSGISGSGMSTQIGLMLLVYNNMVYDLENRSITGSPYTEGIILWQNSGAFIAYNTVFLGGTGYQPNVVDALTLDAGSTNCTVRNNILVNAYHQTEGDTCDAIWLSSTATYSSDYNDLFVDTLWPLSVTAYHVRGSRTLTQWQETGSDAHSVSVMPAFVSPQDIHLSNTSTAVADAAWSIPGIAVDIDGDPRPRPGDPAPDLGADEFEHPTDVEDAAPGVPNAFALEQNYPNPYNSATVMRYTIAASREYGVGNMEVRLVVYDLLGQEVATLVNERKQPGRYEVRFDAGGLASGVYFYRLTSGSFIETRKMVLIR